MKKFFYSVLAAATMLFATTSCSQDDEIVGGGTVDNGTTQKVTFTVQMPDEGVASRAIADGVNVGGGNKADNLIWALYEKGKDNVRLDFGHVTGEKNTETGKHEFTAEISVVKGLEYNILFFAYDDENCVFQLNTVDPDLTALTLKTDLVANEEGYDAFVKCHPYKTGGETDVTLKRPFAQINAATTVADLDKALKLQAVVTKSELVIKDVPTQYNVLTEEATENKDRTYSANDILKHFVATGETAPTHPNEDITVDNVGYKYLAMAYVLAGATKDSEESMHEATFNFYRGTNGDDLMRTIGITSLPIQRNHRTNVIGDLLTETESFKIVIDEEFDGDHNIIEGTIATVTTSQELEEALRQDLETIIVNLGEEVTGRAAEGEKLTFEVNISSYAKKAWGTEKTKTIIINGNGHTIKFIHNDSDWNWISFTNPDTKLFISDAHLTNDEYNDGPWNRHDIRFCNAVELQDVTSDKAIAVLNDATLKNVTISDTRAADDYGLWITAEGQTVELDGCTFNMVKDNNATGRGIKIADEYVNSPALVTLNVKNTTFQTEKKAAVLVTSTAGANITWGEGNDISGVAADKVCAVWVDEEREDYFDKVTVTDAIVIKESEVGKVLYITDKDALIAFEQAVNAGTGYSGKIVRLADDIDLSGVEWNPIGTATSNMFYGTFDGNGKTIKNLTIKRDAGYGNAFFGNLANNSTVKNVTFEKALVQRGNYSYSGNAYGIVAGYVYGSCTFESVNVINSEIHGYGKVGAILGMNGELGNYTITVKDCSVKSTDIYGVYNVAAIVGLVQKGNKVETTNLIVGDDVKWIPSADETYVELKNAVAKEKDGKGEDIIVNGHFWVYGNYLYAGYAPIYCDYEIYKLEDGREIAHGMTH